MNIGTAGLELIKSFERCRLVAYKPTPDDVWTCGWGSTTGVDQATVWTQAEADDALAKDVGSAERCVDAGVSVPLAQNQFDALCSLVFNIGCGAFKGSTLLRKLNAGDVEGARAEFSRWNKQAGKVLSGLTRRRDHEAALFALP